MLGFTIGNDVSERAWQRSDRTLWRAKNTDTFKPMGPWIETDVELDTLETIVRLNGRETIRFRTNDMLFSVRTFISRMSRYLTLYPGDVVWMGTEGGSRRPCTPETGWTSRSPASGCSATPSKRRAER